MIKDDAVGDYDNQNDTKGAAVELCNVERQYARVQALRSTNLKLNSGTFTTLVGPSGCGKSTLLDIIAGLNTGHSGDVFVDHERLTGPRRKTGIIFQDAAVLPWRTVLDNAAFALEVQGVNKRERQRTAAGVLQRVGLSGFEEFYPAQLSGGMRQRCAISRVLSTQPDLILADEPFGALDEQTRLVLGIELLKVVQQSGATVLFVTHSIQEAVMLSDRILVMSARPGQILMDLPVNLPKGRDISVMGHSVAVQLVEDIWSTLRKEAEQALEDHGNYR